MHNIKSYLVKSQICKKLAESISDLDIKEAKLITDNIIEFMIKNLLEFNRIEIRDFGVFSLRPVYKKSVRNPRDNIMINEPMVNWTIHFKPGKKLAYRVRNNV